VTRIVQRVMHCPCGNPKVLALGLCSTCYTLKRQDEEYSGGLREAVLERDGYGRNKWNWIGDGQTARIGGCQGFCDRAKESGTRIGCRADRSWCRG